MGASYVRQYDLCSGEMLGKWKSSLILGYSTEQAIYKMSVFDLAICFNSSFCFQFTINFKSVKLSLGPRSCRMLMYLCCLASRSADFHSIHFTAYVQSLQISFYFKSSFFFFVPVYSHMSYELKAWEICCVTSNVTGGMNVCERRWRFCHGKRCGIPVFAIVFSWVLYGQNCYSIINYISDNPLRLTFEWYRDYWCMLVTK